MGKNNSSIETAPVAPVAPVAEVAPVAPVAPAESPKVSVLRGLSILSDYRDAKASSVAGLSHRVFLSVLSHRLKGITKSETEKSQPGKFLREQVAGLNSADLMEEILWHMDTELDAMRLSCRTDVTLKGDEEYALPAAAIVADFLKLTDKSAASETAQRIIDAERDALRRSK